MKMKYDSEARAKSFDRDPKGMGNNFQGTGMFLCQSRQYAPGCSSDLLGHSDCYLSPVSLPLLNLSVDCGSLVPLSPLSIGWWLGKGTFNTPLFTHIHIERTQTQRALATLGPTLKDNILESKL